MQARGERVTKKAEIAKIAQAMADAASADRGPPILRPKGKRQRPIIALDTDGNPTRAVSHGALIQGLIAREGIDIAVQGVERPEWIRCADCPRRVRLVTNNKRCEGCNKAFRARPSRRANSRQWRQANRERVATYHKRQEAKRKQRRAAVRPLTITCRCGTVVAVGKMGTVPTRCESCRTQDKVKARKDRRCRERS